MVLVNRRYLLLSLMVASAWFNFSPSNLNVTTYKLTCGSRRKCKRQQGYGKEPTPSILVLKIWKSQKTLQLFLSYFIPSCFQEAMVHGSIEHRKQCSKRKDTSFHVQIQRWRKAKSRRNRNEQSLNPCFQNISIWTPVCTSQIVSVKRKMQQRSGESRRTSRITLARMLDSSKPTCVFTVTKDVW